MKETKRKNTFIWGSYPFFSGPQNYFRMSLMIRELTKKCKTGKILDAGCGNGELSFRIAEKGYKVFGTDISHLCINNANNYSRKGLFTHTPLFTQSSLYSLPFSKEFFDGIVCGEVLEHLPNDVKAVKEMYRVLKSGSYTIVTVPAYMKYWNQVDEISGHERRYTVNSLVPLFRNAGFRNVICFDWGFPLSLWWQKYIFQPTLIKITADTQKPKRNPLLKYLFTFRLFHIIFSYIFFLDMLFVGNKKGYFLLLLAKK